MKLFFNFAIQYQYYEEKLLLRLIKRFYITFNEIRLVSLFNMIYFSTGMVTANSFYGRIPWISAVATSKTIILINQKLLPTLQSCHNMCTRTQYNKAKNFLMNNFLKTSGLLIKRYPLLKVVVWA